MVTVTFDPEAELAPQRLEEAVREVDFTPTGVRAWINGRVWDDAPPPGAAPGAVPGAAPGGVIFEATGSGQRFLVTADPNGNGASIDVLRDAAGSVLTINGRATRLVGVDKVVLYLEGIGAPQ